MATIDLNNLIRPKQVNSPNTLVNQQVNQPLPVYVDLHLDLTQAKSIGLGNNVINSSDILVDTDIQAIKNSIYNIFTTRPTQKLLTPTFGCALDQYLFDSVSQFKAQIIGNAILNGIEKFEPRVTVTNVLVTPQPDQNQYTIKVAYTFNELPKQSYLNIIAQQGGQILI